MTTFAYKDGVLAYDSRLTQGDIVIYDDYDKHSEVEGVYFFFRGADSSFGKIIDLYFGNEIKGETDSAAFIYDEDGFWDCSIEDGELLKSPIWLDRPYAQGSGKEFAYSAMDFGKTAKEAVEYAITRDIYSGGEVREFRIEQ